LANNSNSQQRRKNLGTGNGGWTVGAINAMQDWQQ